VFCQKDNSKLILLDMELDDIRFKNDDEKRVVHPVLDVKSTKARSLLFERGSFTMKMKRAYTDAEFVRVDIFGGSAGEAAMFADMIVVLHARILWPPEVASRYQRREAALLKIALLIPEPKRGHSFRTCADQATSLTLAPLRTRLRRNCETECLWVTIVTENNLTSQVKRRSLTQCFQVDAA